MKPPERRSARALQISVGLIISAALIWFSFHNYRFADIWEDVRRVHLLPLLGCVTLATIPFVLRVPRWRVLLRHNDGSALPSPALWNAIAIGFAANNVLPLRAGEVLRVGAISRLGRVSFASALSSVAIERVLDALTVVALLGIGLVTSHLPAGVRIGNGPPIATVAKTTGLLCLVVLFIAILAAWQRALALRAFEGILPSGPVGQRLVTFADNVLRGLGAMRDPQRAIPIIAWSLVVWLVNASAFYLLFAAFQIDVPFSGALILQGALMFAIAVPSSPGFVGIFEGVIPLALSLYGVDQRLALAAAVTYHVSTFIPITFLGALSAVRTGVHLKVPPATP